MHCNNCMLCVHLKSKIINDSGLKKYFCKAFPNEIPLRFFDFCDYSKERECANGFHFEDEDDVNENEEG